MTPPTAPREPLVLTLEEALKTLTGKGWWLSRHTDSWEVWGLDGFEVAICLAHELTWPEAVSIALGRPVVARDEAAELRAENAKLRAAARAWLAAERHTRIINAGATPEARRAYREARGVLKRLAETLAGEEERA